MRRRDPSTAIPMAGSLERRRMLQAAAAMSLALPPLVQATSKQPLQPLLWPSDLNRPLACEPGAAPAVRVAVFGVQRYLPPLIDLAGANNDAALLAAALGRLGVREVTVDTDVVPRARFIERLVGLARASRCGDTVLIHYSGTSFSDEKVAGGQFVLPFSDLRLVDGVLPALARFPPSVWSRSEVRPVLDGALFAGDLVVYLDQMRLRGVNVALVIDGCDGSRLSDQGLAAADPTAPASAWSWRPWLDDRTRLASLPEAVGAAFVLLAPQHALELRLPPGQPNAKSYGAFTFALVTALLELGAEASFEQLVRRTSTLHDHYRLFNSTSSSGIDFGGPSFEASHPHRAMLAVGLPARGRGKVALSARRGHDVSLRSPPLTDGLARIQGNEIVVEGRVDDGQGPPSAVWVNGTTGSILPGGAFRAVVPVRQGENALQLVAYWPTGELALKHFTVISSPRDRLAPTGRRLALLIGIKDYADARLGGLRTPLDDVRAIASELRERFGYETRAKAADGRERSLVLENATREQIVRVLSMLRHELRDEDSLWIYFAGHGVYEHETDQAHWLPADAEDGDPSTWLAAADLRAAVQRLRVRHVLVVADSCFSGAMRSTAEVEPARAADDRILYLERLSLRPSRVVMTSGSNEPVLDTGGRGHSVFARALLQALREQSSPVTARELFYRHVQPAVRARTSQTPQLFPMREGHGGGELVMQPRP